MQGRKGLSQKGKATLKRYREQKNYDGKREAVIAAYENRCASCGEEFPSENLTVHHKDRQGRGAVVKNNDEQNLEPLCRPCHAKEHMQELIAARKAAYGNKWSRKHACCIKCGTTAIRHNANGLCKTCASKHERTLPKSPKPKWSSRHDQCIKCGQTDSPHGARGVCQRCYKAEYHQSYQRPDPRLRAKWSAHHDVCVKCGKSDSPHRAQGKCGRCYSREHAAAARARKRQQ